jgi:hypothetical protein
LNFRVPPPSCCPGERTASIQVRNPGETIRTATIKKAKLNKPERDKDMKKLYGGCECEMVLPLWKTVWRFFNKLKVKLIYDPAIALLCIYAKKPESKA